MKQNVPQDFWQYVDIKGQDECWNYTRCKDEWGYGEIKYFGKNIRTHRLAYQLTFGSIPNGKLVLHRCDNPACCNPHHLFIGTNEDNMKDMRAKQRGDGPHTLKSGNELTRDDIEKIFALRKEGKRQSIIASLFNADQSTISKILGGHRRRNN